MAHINPGIPAVGSPNSSEEPKIATALTQLVGQVNLEDDQQVGTDGVWRTVMADGASGASSAGTNFFANGAAVLSGTGGTQIPRLLIPNASDYTVVNRTTKLRVQASIAPNAAPSGTTITFGLYPVTSLTGTTANVVYTLGSVVAGSTVTLTIGSGSWARSASGAFDYSLAATPHVLGFTAPSSAVGVHLYGELQQRHV